MRTSRQLPDPYGDPRLVALYDRDNPDGPDHDFFRALADRLNADTIVDLGCGTGILTVTLARAGRTVIGIDPSAAMLEHARARAGADLVDWRLGDTGRLAGLRADLVIMSGNVAQHILGTAWTATLHAISQALGPAGVLAFESRNPQARPWEGWTERRTRSSRPTEYGQLTEWVQVSRIADGQVSFEAYTVFRATGERLVCTSTLAFRDKAELESSLNQAGLAVESVHGGWDARPVDPDSPLLVVTARRP